MSSPAVPFNIISITAEKYGESMKKHGESVPVSVNPEKLNLQRRARAKFATLGLSEQLIYLGGSLTSSYVRSLDCASVLHLKDGKLTGRYCGNRWCFVCNRIRTGKLINGYREAMAEIPNKYFLTLTVPNVTGDKLSYCIELMHVNLKKSTEVARKKGIKLNGFRKLECTYNVIRNDYHPHFHLVIESEYNCQFILSQWLARYPYASSKAQDIRPADDGSLLELFKYFTKLISKGKRSVDPVALDVIFRAMRGRRVFQPFGTIRKKLQSVTEEVEELQAFSINADELYETWYVWTGQDWANTDGGEMLTDWKPSKAILAYIDLLKKER